MHKGDYAIHVVPSLEHMELFHISRVHAGYETKFLKTGFEIENLTADDMRNYYGTKEPIHYNSVMPCLSLQFGIDDPAAEAWSGKVHSGMSKPFGDPGTDLEVMRKAINQRWPGKPEF